MVRFIFFGFYAYISLSFFHFRVKDNGDTYRINKEKIVPADKYDKF